MMGSHLSRVCRFIPFRRFNQYTPSRYRSHFQFCCMRVTIPVSKFTDSQSCRFHVHPLLLFDKGTPYKGKIIYHQVVIYLFLIERVHIVRGGTKTRSQDKLYWFHLLGLVPYLAIVALTIIFRYDALDAQGHCSIGLQRASSFPLLIYDLLIQVPTMHHRTNIGLSHWTIPFSNAWIVLLPDRSKSPSSSCCQENVQYVSLCLS